MQIYNCTTHICIPNRTLFHSLIIFSFLPFNRLHYLTYFFVNISNEKKKKEFLIQFNILMTIANGTIRRERGKNRKTAIRYSCHVTQQCIKYIW